MSDANKLLEKKFQASVVNDLRVAGYFCGKNNSAMGAIWPDYTVLPKIGGTGGPYYVEFKTILNTNHRIGVTPRQARNFAEMQSRGVKTVIMAGWLEEGLMKAAVLMPNALPYTRYSFLQAARKYGGRWDVEMILERIDDRYK
jgi:hypothetical protein